MSIDKWMSDVNTGDGQPMKHRNRKQEISVGRKRGIPVKNNSMGFHKFITNLKVC